MFKFKARVWLYPGMAGWQFITVPKKYSTIITQTYGSMKKGWGSLPVSVRVGKTKWRTSIFPDKKLGAYVLPLKADVRKKESIQLDTMISLTLEIIV